MTSFDGYVCDSSVEPGVVIQTFPPKINCDEMIAMK